MTKSDFIVKPLKLKATTQNAHWRFACLIWEVVTKCVKPQGIQVLIYHQFRERTYSLIFLFKVSHVVSTHRQEVHCSKAAKPHDTRKEEEKMAAHSQYWSQLFKDICRIQFLSISNAKLLLKPRIGTLKKGSCREHRAMNMWKLGCLAYYYFFMQKLRFLSCLRAKVRHQ